MKRIIITSICSALMFVATLFGPSINSESSIDSEEYKLRHDLSIWEEKEPQGKAYVTLIGSKQASDVCEASLKTAENCEARSKKEVFTYPINKHFRYVMRQFCHTLSTDYQKSQVVAQNYVKESRSVEKQDTEATNIEGRSAVPEITQEKKDEYTQIAQKYLELYESGEWDGEEALEEDVKVSLFLGEMKTNGYLTGVKTSQRLLCDKLEAMYISGEWDGKLTVIDEHTAEIDEEFGCLLIDSEETCIGKRPLDMTEDYFFHHFDSFTYVKGIGVYIIEDNQLKRLERQKLITLPGEKIEFDEGLYLLYYDNEEGVLYIYLFKDGEDITYRVPDLDKSEIEFVNAVEVQS